MKNVMTTAIKTILGLGSFGLGTLLLALAHSQSAEFRAVKLPNQGERVTGITCSSATACVISTDPTGGAQGHLYASDGQKITGTVLTADTKFAESVGVLGDIGFNGFSRVGDQTIALLANSAKGFVSAKGDVATSSNWSVTKIGSSEGGFGLNQQMGIGMKDDRWVYIAQSYVFESTDAPGKGALWTNIWSPASPSVPTNFDELRRADPSLCNNEPGVGWAPKLTQPAYVASDLSVILYPSGARNQRGSDPAGVCISVDGGKRFNRIEFQNVDNLGPLGVTCVSSSRCFAYGGLDFNPASSFIFVTNDAQKGAKSTWTLAKLPSLRENTTFRHIFFAPGSTNGWAVGSVNSSSPLLFSSTDGGSSWKDVSALVRAVAPDVRLHSGYAVDATHVWVGGEKNTLLTLGY